MVVEILEAAPDAFRRLLADEQDAPRTELRWLRRAAGTSSIGGMWVRPESRRTGAGRALLEAGIEWGRRQRAVKIRLAVAIGNRSAERLYAEAGFSATGETEPLREGSDLMIAWLESAT